MKICVAGEGAFGQKHLDALRRIPGVEVTCLVGGNQQATAEVAKKYAIPHHTGDLGDGIERADGVILTTPTPLHRQQAEQVMRARKHVLIEIPIADSVEDSEALLAIQKETGVVAMAGHVRRFAVPTSMQPANRAAGPITSSGITRPTRWICFNIRAVSQ